MTAMGEAFEENEMDYMLDLALEKGSSNVDFIDIERLAKILIPSDNIVDDLK